MKRFVLTICCMVVGTYASAAPSFDCDKAESQAEHVVCSDEHLAQLDNRLSDRFKAATAAAKALSVGAAEAEAQLRATQRGWIKGRDECWKSSDPRECVEQSYLYREGELVALWLLEPVTKTAFWTCSNPADEVVTMFFDTRLPTVRLEIGDRISTAALVRTASGSRYEGSFGESIWIKGDAAYYRAPSPNDGEKKCTLRAEQ